VPTNRSAIALDTIVSTIDLGDDIKPKKYREQRRQFAEAVLADAVLDADPATAYQHPGLAGLTVFDAGSDSAVPAYGPVFAG
jgi:putative ATP-dependent endonuclease of the OLD family